MTGINCISNCNSANTNSAPLDTERENLKMNTNEETLWQDLAAENISKNFEAYLEIFSAQKQE